MPNIRLPRQELAKRQKPNLDDRGMMDLPFLILVTLLVAIGLVMMFSASFVRARYETAIPCIILSARRFLAESVWRRC